MERILPLGWKEQNTTIHDEDQQTPDTIPVFQIFRILITHLGDQLRKQPQLPAAGHFPPIYRGFKIADAFLYPPSLPETPDYILQRNETESDKRNTTEYHSNRIRVSTHEYILLVAENLLRNDSFERPFPKALHLYHDSPFRSRIAEQES
jgi:hypothetical protein